MQREPKTARLGGTHPENLFQRIRLKAGLSQEEAADRLSCPLRTFQRYESGEAEPNYPVLCSMIDCYNCEAADFFPDLSLLRGETGGDAQCASRWMTLLSH